MMRHRISTREHRPLDGSGASLTGTLIRKEHVEKAVAKISGRLRPAVQVDIRKDAESGTIRSTLSACLPKRYRKPTIRCTHVLATV